MSTWQFVDSISGSATLRLDLNSSANGFQVSADGVDLSPPALRRVTVSSMLSTGERIPASAYANRVLKIPIQFRQTTVDNAADKLQSLARELARPAGNFLKVALGSNAMYFRTLPAPDAGWSMVRDLAQYGRATLEIPAEPFGYGVKETLSNATVNNDPASGTNPLCFDIAASTIKGDVETPLYFIAPNGLIATGRRRSLLTVRRRGTPSSAPQLKQVDAMTQGTDTSTSAMAGSSGGSGSRCTFATNTGLVTRASTTAFPAAASVDARGSYRVFVRVRQNTATDTMTMRLRWGDANALVSNDSTTLPSTPDTGVWFYVDLGEIQIPGGFDPAEDGPSGVSLSASPIYLSLDAQRNSGAGSLDMDVLVFFPSDDCTQIIKWPAVSGPTDLIIDGGSNEVYPRDAAAAIDTVDQSEVVGGAILVSPGAQAQRVFFARDIGTGTSGTGLGGDVLTATTTLTPFYWPRYIFALKPTST